MKSMSSSSSSFNTNHQWKYDVFINFRGDDCRNSFVSHLYAALSNKGIITFLDDEKLEKGSELQPQLLRAIQGSRICLVVFSENYSRSSWCLLELEKIMEYRGTNGQIVMPIFYHIDPAIVRRQLGDFGEALEVTAKKMHSKRERQELLLQTWKSALNQATRLSGWDVTAFRNESELVRNIVEHVRGKLDDTFVPLPEHTVGLESRVEKMVPWIENKSTKVCMVGIWGMGGLGKTTVAKAIYNQIHRKFERRSFIENIRETCERDSKGGWHICLQQQLLSDLLETKEKIHNIASGTIAIKKMLSANKVLIVLDDVTKVEQVKALYGSRKWFGSGSVLIVTSRDKHILMSLQVDHLYPITEMNQKESLELFSWHAFKNASPRADFSELSRSVIKYCGGLPLAAEVIGSYLYGRSREEWTCVLSKLEIIPHHHVQEKLRISYDGLSDGKEKDIFLDICCFLIGKDRAYVTEILNGCGLFASIGIPVLIERSLLKVEKNNKLGMHDLIRDMGREIVRQNSEKGVREISEKDPGERSRLWFQKDVHDVLTNNTGTKTVEGLILNLERTSRASFNTSAFQEMKKLRLLQLDCVDLTGDFEFLSKQLRWVNWRQSTFNHVPNNFYQGNLVVFELKYSMVKQVWKETLFLDKLKILNLSHSKYLKSTPDFSLLPSLEKLIMKDCPNLSKVHPSIGDLNNLLLINFKDCTSLGNLPGEIYQLMSVTTLILDGCSNIIKLEEDVVQMKSLTTLRAAGTGIKKAPFSVVGLKSIVYISLCGVEGFACDVFPGLIWSLMSPTINSLPHSPHPRSVGVQYRSEIQLTEELKRLLNHLNSVDFTESETSYALQISDLSLKSFFIITLGNSLPQGLTTSGSNDCFVPVDNYPSWLSYTCTGPSVRFRVPEDSDCCMKGITLCVVYSSTSENMAAECLIGVLIINYTKLTINFYMRDTVKSFNAEDWQGVKSNLEAGDNVEIFVALGHGMTVKETGVYLILGQSSTMEVESSMTMEVGQSTMVKMEPLPEVEVQTPPNVKIEPSPEEEVQSSLDVKNEASLEPSLTVQNKSLQKSTMEVESSMTMEVEQSIMVKMEPLPEVEVQTPPNVKIEPSPEEEVQSSLDVENEASLITQNEPSLEPSLTVQSESLPKPNENIFVKLGKRVGKCVCLKQE